jgi:hypothetical protein
MKCYQASDCPDFRNERFLCCFGYIFCSLRKEIDAENLRIKMRTERNRLIKLSGGRLTNFEAFKLSQRERGYDSEREVEL